MVREALVRAESVERVYGNARNAVTALASATFTVYPSDLIALVGPSGSGKSTLLHLVAGLDTPTNGMIEWPALGARDQLRPGPIGFAFQGPSLLPPLTTIENVALPMILFGSGDDAAFAAARDLLDAFGVLELASKLPEELSGGQAQRVGMARAFAGSPRLVLADEPTGQLDRATATRVMDAALAIASTEGIALVVATHDRSIAGGLPVIWAVDGGRMRIEDVPCSA